MDLYYTILEHDMQNKIDSVLQAKHYTGAAYDRVTKDWACWLEGHVIGWQASKKEAEKLIREQRIRNLERNDI